MAGISTQGQMYVGSGHTYSQLYANDRLDHEVWPKVQSKAGPRVPGHGCGSGSRPSSLTE